MIKTTVLLAFAIGMAATQDLFINPDKSRHLAMNQGGMTSTYTGNTTSSTTTKPSNGATTATKPAKQTTTKPNGGKVHSKSTCPISKSTTAGKHGART